MGDDAIEQLTEYLDSVDVSMDQLEHYSGIDWYNYLMDKQSISAEEWNQIHAAAGEAKEGPMTHMAKTVMYIIWISTSLALELIEEGPILLGMGLFSVAYLWVNLSLKIE